MKVKVGKITRTNGVAGQISYATVVTYPGEEGGKVSFVGSTYGGPVLMLTPGCPDGVFVTDPARFGKFSPEWVRRFFGSSE